MTALKKNEHHMRDRAGRKKHPPVASAAPAAKSGTVAISDELHVHRLLSWWTPLMSGFSCSAGSALRWRRMLLRPPRLSGLRAVGKKFRFSSRA